jgi:hypothetical protein
MTPTTLRVLFVLLFTLAPLGACGSGSNRDDATCESITDHMTLLLTEEHASQGRPPMDAETVARRRKRQIERCEARDLSQPERECLLAARDRGEVDACDSRRAP